MMNPAEAGGASAEGGKGSVAWAQPYFAALAKYLRASRGGMPRLQAHLLQARPSTAARGRRPQRALCSHLLHRLRILPQWRRRQPVVACRLAIMYGLGWAPVFLQARCTGQLFVRVLSTVCAGAP